jgi:hypothetical protein
MSEAFKTNTPSHNTESKLKLMLEHENYLI